MNSTETFKVNLAVSLILKKGDKLLLYKRINTHYENGNYGLIGGYIDGKETVQQGIAREAKEESGIDIRVEDLKVVHVMHSMAVGRYGEFITVFLEASNWEGELANMEPDRCGDLSWFPVNNLPENMVSQVSSALENIEKGFFFSNFGW